jgi:hypothetical protein
MNQPANMNGVVANQIATLGQAGYFTTPVPNVNTLPAYSSAANTNYSLEYRVRSYLAVNCVQCHQAGGAGAATWDARAFLTLAQTGLINGALNDNGNDPTNKLIVPGDVAHSVLLQRVKGNGFSRMPPLATHQVDQTSIQLLEMWIGSDLTNRLTFAQWQSANFGSTNNSTAAASADPDGDGANNYVEFLTGTNPQNPADYWRLGLSAEAGLAKLSYQRAPNLGVVIESGSDFSNWVPWNVAGNQPFFGAAPATVLLQGPLSMTPPFQYFRARLVEP